VQHSVNVSDCDWPNEMTQCRRDILTCTCSQRSYFGFTKRDMSLEIREMQTE